MNQQVRQYHILVCHGIQNHDFFRALVMECAFGLKGKDYVIVACDGHVDFSIINFKKDEDKIRVVDDNKLFATAGPQAERTQFMEYIEKNINLYRLKTGVQLTTRAAANFTRTQLAQFLRKSPYNVNLIVGGYEAGKGPQLFFMDYLGSIHELSRCAHGYAAHFTLGLLDRFYKKDLSEAEGIEIIHRCISELETRLIVNRSGFVIKIVDKNGVRVIPTKGN